MSKHLSFAAAVSSVECQRCGNRLLRNERYCCRCGAFGAVVPDAARAGEVGQDPAPLIVIEGPWAERDEPDFTSPDCGGRYLVYSPAPVPLLKRTLNVRTALLAVCAASVIACGLTYLFCSVTNRDVDSSGELNSESRADVAPNTDATADSSYMTPKSLGEIDAQLGGTTGTSVPPSASGDLEPSAAVPPTSAQTSTNAAGIIQKAPQNTLAAGATRPVSPPQPAAPRPNSSDAQDRDVLERAILEYGWKTSTEAKRSQ